MRQLAKEEALSKRHRFADDAMSNWQRLVVNACFNDTVPESVGSPRVIIIILEFVHVRMARESSERERRGAHSDRRLGGVPRRAR